MNNEYDITNDVNYNQPYTFMSRVVDAIFNFLAAIGFIAFAAGCGYLYSRFV